MTDPCCRWVRIILLFGLLAICFQPLPVLSPKPPVAAKTLSLHLVKPVMAETPPPTPTPTPTPVITWMDNPEHCDTTRQWIAAEEPFYCIDKVQPTPQPIQTQTSRYSAQQAVTASVGGSHQDWMKAAGIAPSDWMYVNYIVSRESGWNPNAVNASSGACGLGQQLPCGKWAHTWNDPVGALIDASDYARRAYGSWYGAYCKWLASHWW